MKLYDLLKKTEGEITVWDKEYDIETYFYGIKNRGDDLDDWDRSIIELAKLLDVTDASDGAVTVNLSEVIGRNIDALKRADLFIRCDIDAIMADIMNILAGHVSENWLKEFVYVLNGGARKSETN